MFQKYKLKPIVGGLILTLLAVGSAKFYHYNHVANKKGQARALRLPGFDDLVCGGFPYKHGAIDHCGKRAIYADGDWGITAYFTIFGVQTREEAQAIADFMIAARKKNHQEHIPMNLEVYSIPRSEADTGHPRKYKIFDENL